MTGQTVRFYNFDGECIRYGQWWKPLTRVFRLGSRAFVLREIVRGQAIYEEVWG